jgi:hypothetical protein
MKRSGNRRATYRSCASIVAVAVLLGVSPAEAFNPLPGCNIQRYQPLCDAYRPAAQYTGTLCPGTPGPTWPICTTPINTQPDLGYRYPLVPPIGAPRLAQDTGLDWWPICVSDDLVTVQSNPGGGQTCGAGLFEVGRCQASAHYNEKFLGPDGVPAEHFYGFVVTHPACLDPINNGCGPCAHDALTAVTSCKQLCDRYFGRLRYDKTAPDNGMWIDDPTHPHSLANEQFTPNPPDEPDDFVGKTPYEVCLDICGPPDDDGDVAAHADGPPWVSTLDERDRTPAEKNNHWYFTVYGRGRNPNERLDLYFRSYAVNRDKPTAPAHICQVAVNNYCDQIINADLGDTGVTPKRVKCKKDLLEGPLLAWALDFDGDGTTVEAGGGGDDSFCEHLFRANALCPATCYHRAADAAVNPVHFCGEELTGGMDLCDEPTATCYCADALGNRIGCNTATIVGPVKRCSPTTVTGSSVSVGLFYRTAQGAFITSGAQGTWWNKRLPDAPRLLVAIPSFSVWVSDIPVPLKRGVNEIVVRISTDNRNFAVDHIRIDAPNGTP